MPTYRNDTERRVTHADKTYLEWGPGEAKSLPYFVPWKDLGLALADEKPYVRKNTSVYDYQEFELQPGDRLVYDIPYRETFELSLSAIKGAVRMYVGDGDVPTVIDGLHDHVSTYAWDQTAYLTFEAMEIVGASDNVAQIIIKVEAKTWKEARKRGEA